MSEDTIQLNQFLSFTLDGELFALNISHVREILDLLPITRIPRCPPAMRGVINLRGRAAPVIDLRTKFGMGATEPTVDTCIIITEVESDDGRSLIGMLADSVQEVLEIEPEAIEPPPSMGLRVDTQFMTGMGRHGDGFIMIMDVVRIFASMEHEMSMCGQQDCTEAA